MGVARSSYYATSVASPFIVSDPAFTWLGRGTLWGVPISVYLMGLVFLAGEILLSRTTYGRSLYAIGGNDEASRLAGLRTVALRASSYVICGACAAVAGIIVASRLSIGQADIGSTMALHAIAVVVIGGSSLMGGEGAVWRSGIGLLIVAVLTNLLDSLAVDSNYQLVIKGTIVVAAVALDAYARILSPRLPVRSQSPGPRRCTWPPGPSCPARGRTPRFP